MKSKLEKLNLTLCPRMYVASSKSYVDAYVAQKVNLEVASLIITFESTKKIRFSLKNSEVANFSKKMSK